MGPPTLSTLWPPFPGEGWIVDSKGHVAVETEAGSGLPRPGKRDPPHHGAGLWGSKNSSPPAPPPHYLFAGR